MRNLLRFRVVAMVLLALGLFAGSIANVGAQATPIVGEPGSLVVSKFECTQLEVPRATVSDPVDDAGGEGAPEEGCEADVAFFQIFLNNDFSAEPFAEFEAGVETINGIPQNAPGVPHLLLETEQNFFFEFFVESGSVTTITVLNPAEGGATPVPGDKDGGDKDGDGGGDDKDGDTGGDDKDGDTGGDTGGDDKDGGAADGGDTGGAADGGDTGGAADGGDTGGAADGGDTGGAANGGDTGGAAADGGTTAGGAAVNALPSTGQGTDNGTSGSAIVLLFGAMSLVALVAGFAWRQRRTA